MFVLGSHQPALVRAPKARVIKSRRDLPLIASHPICDPSGRSICTQYETLSVVPFAMPKRKAVQEGQPASGSDLSPPPEDLNDGAVALASDDADLQSQQQPAKKRRAATGAVKKELKAEPAVAETASTPKRNTRARKAKPEESVGELPIKEEEDVTPNKKQSKTKSEEGADAGADQVSTKTAPKGRGRKTAVKEDPESVKGEGKAAEQPAKKKRKTKEEKEAEAMPLAARTAGHKLYIGAHVSSAGGEFRPIQLHSVVIHSTQSRFNAKPPLS